MNTYSKSILLITNGTKDSLPALEYGMWLSGILKIPVKLVGISENRRMVKTVKEAIKNAQFRMDKLDIHYEVQLEQGEACQVICRLANPEENLVIVGPLGRPRWVRWLRGRTFRRIMKNINTPLIYVPAAKNQIEHILVCMGGLGYAHCVENWAIYLAQHSAARITILHIVERAYYEYPTSIQIQTHWEEILSTDTPQAYNLRIAIQNARDAGIPVEIKVRHGDIVHEIIAEIRESQYDLISLGSQGSSRSLRRLFTPNVTAVVAESISIPVLTSHTVEGLILE